MSSVELEIQSYRGRPLFHSDYGEQGFRNPNQARLRHVATEQLGDNWFDSHDGIVDHFRRYINRCRPQPLEK